MKKKIAVISIASAIGALAATIVNAIVRSSKNADKCSDCCAECPDFEDCMSDAILEYDADESDETSNKSENSTVSVCCYDIDSEKFEKIMNLIKEK